MACMSRITSGRKGPVSGHRGPVPGGARYAAKQRRLSRPEPRVSGRQILQQPRVVANIVRRSGERDPSAIEHKGPVRDA
jgi:hypothetical protein